jgi:hypothetical protein
VQRLARRASATAVLSLLVRASLAAAQQPVCAQPDPERPVYELCAPGARFVVSAILTDLAIDETIRGQGAPILREPRALFHSVASQTTLDKNPALDEFLTHLSPVKLTRFDTATGALRMDVGEEERNFHSTIVLGDAATDLSLSLPERIEGGYWRTPGALQMAFWKDRRIRIHVNVSSGEPFDAEIECAAISGDGIRLVTSGDDIPDVLVHFDSCR